MTDNLIQFFLAVLAISISIAGLASLISLFKTASEFTTDEIFVFRSIILFSLCVGLAAIFPASLLILKLREQLVWAICSSIYALIASVLLIRLIIEALSGKWVIVYKRNAYTVMTITVIVVAWLIANTFIFQKPDAYVGGLLWGLIVLGVRLYLFLMTLTELKLKKKPLSRPQLPVSHKQENEKATYRKQLDAQPSQKRSITKKIKKK